MTADMEDRFRHDCEWAERQLKKDGGLGPLFVLLCGDSKRLVVSVPTGPHIEKRLVYGLLHLIAVMEDATAVTAIMEAWMLRGDDAAPGIMPRDSERRVEIVSVTTTWRDAGGVMRSRASLRDILRDRKGKVTGLGTESLPEGATLEGLLTEILPPLKPPQALRDAARELLANFIGKLPDGFEIKRTLH